MYVSRCFVYLLYKDVKIYDNAQQIVEEKILFGCRLDKATV